MGKNRLVCIIAPFCGARNSIYVLMSKSDEKVLRFVCVQSACVINKK